MARDVQQDSMRNDRKECHDDQDDRKLKKDEPKGDPLPVFRPIQMKNLTGSEKGIKATALYGTPCNAQQ
jgi:hypothetical protein